MSGMRKQRELVETVVLVVLAIATVVLCVWGVIPGILHGNLWHK